MSDDKCYFCNETRCLERHHIVPRRFNGSDNDENLVKVCGSCHVKLESLYDNRFYKRLGVLEPSSLENDHRSYDRIRTSARTVRRLPEKTGWKVKYDDKQQFMFSCPECRKAGHLLQLSFDQRRYEFIFDTYCPRCDIRGSKKLYAQPQQDIDSAPLDNLIDEIEPPANINSSGLDKKTEFEKWIQIGKNIKQVDQTLRKIWRTNTLPKEQRRSLRPVFDSLNDFRSKLEDRMFEEHAERGELDVFY